MSLSLPQTPPWLIASSLSSESLVPDVVTGAVPEPGGAIAIVFLAMVLAFVAGALSRQMGKAILLGLFFSGILVAFGLARV